MGSTTLKTYYFQMFNFAEVHRFYLSIEIHPVPYSMSVSVANYV